MEGGSPQFLAPPSDAASAPRTRPIYPPAPPPELKPIPRWVWISVAAFVLVIGFVCIPIYRAVRREQRLGSSVVRTIHSQMRAGDDAAIFNAADTAYQQQVGRKKSDELFDWVRSSLGAPHHSQRTGTFTSTSTEEGTVLTLDYRTNFDKGVGTETFRLHKVNGVYLLLRYTVVSPQIRQQDVPQDLQPK